ncbi:MAG: PEP-CTERM sorting domain-containing protein [Sphingomonas sp.]|nr:PEP-CTERM sorting domain-containing protein [Sphingomonas sp.]
MSSAVITINGVAYGLTGISYGEISADEQRRRFAVEDWDNSDGVQAQVITTFYDPSQGLPARVKASGTYSLPANEGDPSYPYEPNFTILDHGNLALGSMKPTLFSVSLLVPEPASWAMLLLGFGSIGAAMRRRGKVALRPA